jgi:hypothetical protein
MVGLDLVVGIGRIDNERAIEAERLLAVGFCVRVIEVSAVLSGGNS